MLTEHDLPPLEVRTISDRLVDIVREIILSGALPSGVPIRQDSLASYLKVSKIPLREALVRLEQDGLVRSLPNRGYFVRALSAQEAEEIFALRKKLEPDAVAEACCKASEDEQEEARQALAKLDAAAAQRMPVVSALNRSFHIALVRPCRKEVTTELLMRLHVMADRYVSKHLEPRGRHIRAEAEHQNILNAWLRRDADKAHQLVLKHLENTLRDLRKEVGIANDADSTVSRTKRAARGATTTASSRAANSKRKNAKRKKR